jgi:small subunit ribosomal protein S3
MTHKVHPKIYRVGESKDWQSKGFYEKDFARFLREDYQIRGFLREVLREMSVERIEIERSFDDIGVLIYSSRPGLIIGRGGEGVKLLKEKLEKRVNTVSKDGKKKIRLEIKEIKDPWLSASLAAQDIARQLEKRLPYRKVVKQALHKIAMHKEVKGVRIQVSGRLNGIEIARSEYFQEGQLKRQTIRGNIDYGFDMARCSYGAIGIKVFIYKGEKFDQ